MTGDNMNTRSRLSLKLGAALWFASTTAVAAPPVGAIFTTDQSGTIVNGNAKYASKCGASGVYLDGGPGANAPQHAAGLADGDYYFQVTDSSGRTLLSTDPVQDRCITVAGGMILGTCATGTHNTFLDADYGSSGAHTVELCGPGAPFADAADGVYKVWVTPVGDGTLAGEGFFGDPTLIDNSCGDGRGKSGCFHGFLGARSKTDNFKVSNSQTLCIRATKQVAFSEFGSQPAPGWEILITDANGTTNSFFTDEFGSTGDQICGLAPGNYTVAEAMIENYQQVRVELNGVPIDSSSVLVALGTGSMSGDQTVLFINKFIFEGSAR
jgi:hypothetical protein